MWLWCRQNGIPEVMENEEKTSLINLSEILPKRAISSSVRLQTTLNHCAVADLRFLARLHEVQKSYCSHPGRTRSRSRSRSTLR